MAPLMLSGLVNTIVHHTCMHLRVRLGWLCVDLVGWFAAGWVGWLAGWLVMCWTDELVSSLLDRLVGWIRWLASWLSWIGWMIGRWSVGLAVWLVLCWIPCWILNLVVFRRQNPL